MGSAPSALPNACVTTAVVGVAACGPTPELATQQSPVARRQDLFSGDSFGGTTPSRARPTGGNPAFVSTGAGGTTRARGGTTVGGTTVGGGTQPGALQAGVAAATVGQVVANPGAASEVAETLATEGGVRGTISVANPRTPAEFEQTARKIGAYYIATYGEQVQAGRQLEAFNQQRGSNLSMSDVERSIGYVVLMMFNDGETRGANRRIALPTKEALESLQGDSFASRIIKHLESQGKVAGGSANAMMQIAHAGTADADVKVKNDDPTMLPEIVVTAKRKFSGTRAAREKSAKKKGSFTLFAFRNRADVLAEPTPELNLPTGTLNKVTTRTDDHRRPGQDPVSLAVRSGQSAVGKERNDRELRDEEQSASLAAKRVAERARVAVLGRHEDGTPIRQVRVTKDRRAV